MGAPPDGRAPSRGNSSCNEDRWKGGPTLNTILVATDGSAASREAVEFGIELAEEQGATVVFVHVAPHFDRTSLDDSSMVGGLLHEISPADERPLEDAASIAERHGLRWATKVLSGHVVDEIVTYADNLDADLIVVGSRGHRGIAGALLGSVSRGVLSESKRPVAVIRGHSVERPPVLTR